MTITLLWFAAISVQAAPHPTKDTVDSLLHCIDTAIGQTDKYVQKKTDRIEYLHTKLDKAETLSAKYELSYQLYTEYLPFVNDSAIFYLEQCTDIARKLNDPSKTGGCLSLMALCCSNAGIYLESVSILKTIDPSQLNGIDLGLYYYAYSHVSNELAYYGKFANMRKQYADASTRYFTLAQQHLPSNHKYNYMSQEIMLHKHNNIKQSLSINNQWLQQVQPGSTEYATVAYYRYLDYKAMGDSIQMMYWLAESVLSDVKNAVMDQGSVWEMANQLMSRGDVDRSYRYICFTSD